MRDKVVLVDERDRMLGAQAKARAHREGKLHRAISVFVFTSDGRWLLQQRHPEKYHSGGLWSNTCCSHPQPGEASALAASERLMEEMGLHCPLEHRFTFLYRHRFGNGLLEHELDHVYLGVCDQAPAPDPLEIVEWRWVDTRQLTAEVARTPENFSYWFRLAWRRALTEHERMCHGLEAKHLACFADLRRAPGAA